MIHKTHFPALNAIVASFKQTTNCQYVVPQGAIYATSSDLDIEGRAIFTNNDVLKDGGEERRGTCIVVKYINITNEVAGSLPEFVVSLSRAP